MGIISKDKRKITLYYHSETSLGKQTYAYVETSRKHVLAIDIAKTEVTGTQWTEIAEGLGIEIANLVNKNHPDFIKEYGGPNVNLETEGWINVLKNNPHLLVCPIVVMDHKFIKLPSPSDFVRLLESDSAGTENID
ncbi:hypothetical protein H4O18_18765 [Arenibacter sp. BSSL-BM3]|uniref:Arsenate reductase n=1 Tax=Arenibacter arenosicollis TaxID=2762274 RepID=A0ABR7QS82_9FLAO|nr:hypothetical protein [Arenibacter arenosicollis]MBC8770049.1 hypothetical protein [Arenibacter arenosicollis]